jgi:hypothetical protein
MTFKVYHRVIALLLVALLLATLMIPVFAAGGAVMAANETHETGLVEESRSSGGPVVIACVCPDPGGSGGACC